MQIYEKDQDIFAMKGPTDDYKVKITPVLLVARNSFYTT